jgi:transcriptional regulator with XRE-family HTH domain
MAGVAKHHGPTSERVAANLRRIRRQREMTTAQLSRRLAELGQPIQDTGITKIEKGERRVDVDDLMALALALGVTPNALLLPHMELAGLISYEGPLAPRQNARAEEMWAWATGELPLGHAPALVTDDDPTRNAEVTFAFENRPHRFGPASASKFLQDLDEALEKRAMAQNVIWIGDAVISAYRLGFTSAEVRNVVENAIAASLILSPADFPKRSEEEFLARFDEVRRTLDRLNADSEDDPGR